jgi:hypothetical protein
MDVSCLILDTHMPAFFSAFEHLITLQVVHRHCLLAQNAECSVGPISTGCPLREHNRQANCTSRYQTICMLSHVRGSQKILYGKRHEARHLARGTPALVLSGRRPHIKNPATSPAPYHPNRRPKNPPIRALAVPIDIYSARLKMRLLPASNALKKQRL